MTFFLNEQKVLCGFSAVEQFSGFDKATPASQRWRKLAQRKQVELERAAAGIATMQTLLKQMARCNCDALDECGEGLLERQCDAQDVAFDGAALRVERKRKRPAQTARAAR